MTILNASIAIFWSLQSDLILKRNYNRYTEPSRRSPFSIPAHTALHSLQIPTVNYRRTMHVTITCVSAGRYAVNRGSGQKSRSYGYRALYAARDMNVSVMAPDRHPEVVRGQELGMG